MKPAHRFSLLALLLGALVAACDSSELRVPYIPPKLENWPQPYRGVAGMKVHAFTTGWLDAPEALIVRGGGMTRRRQLPVPAFLIEHPRHGLVLVGAGLSPQQTQKMRGLRDWIGLGPQPHAPPGSDVRSQMRAAGLKPDAVRWIIEPSLRPDQTGALEQFPAAQVVVAKTEYDGAAQAGDTDARESFDNVLNWKLIDFAPPVALATFPAHVDLLGDRSVLLVDVHGATPGTMAVLVRLPDRPLLLTGDMLTLHEQLRHVAQPASAADINAWWQQAWRLKRFKELVPELIVVPAHDLQPLQEVTSRHIIVHPAAAIDAPPGPTATPSVLQRLIPPRLSSVLSQKLAERMWPVSGRPRQGDAGPSTGCP